MACGKKKLFAICCGQPRAREPDKCPFREFRSFTFFRRFSTDLAAAGVPLTPCCSRCNQMDSGVCVCGSVWCMVEVENGCKTIRRLYINNAMYPWPKGPLFGGPTPPKDTKDPPPQLLFRALLLLLRWTAASVRRKLTRSDDGERLVRLPSRGLLVDHRRPLQGQCPFDAMGPERLFGFN